MPEIGQSSHAIEEEEIRDISVDTEQLIGYAPVAPVQSESEEDEGGRADIPEAVRGGVFRFDGEDEDVDVEAEEAETDGSDDDVEAEEAETDGAEEAAEADPEEDPEELAVEPLGYQDDMGTTSDDIIEELTTHNAQLEDRIAHLEEQNTVHQEREEQYRDLAYQWQAENEGLRQQLQQDRAADSQHMLEMAEHRAHAEALADRLRAERDNARMELQILGDDWTQTRDDRDTFYDAWQLTVARIRELEEEVRTSTTRSEVASFGLDTAFGRLRSRVRRYPREEDMSRRSIPRRIVDLIARQEHENAILRGGL